MDANLKMSRAVTRLIADHPFFGAFALALDIEEVEEGRLPFPTMATNGKTIFWVRSFVDRISEPELVGVLLHEIMHVVMMHPLRLKGRDQRAFNVACDYAINPLIKEWGFSLPPDGLDDPKYHGMMAEKIYDLLPRINVGGGGGDKNSGKGSGDQQGWGDILPPTKDGSVDGEAASESDIKLMEVETQQRIATAETVAKSIGKMPAGLETLIEKARPPQVQWQDVIRRFVGGEQPDDYSYRKLNKRMFHGYRAVAPGIVKTGCGHIVIGGDSSGSVSDTEWAHFLGEMNAISEELSPESITLIQCDSIIQRVDRYGPGEFIDNVHVKGRGGTLVSPVFKYIRDNDLPVDHFLYLTDMEVCDFPKNPPAFPVMWVNSSGNGGGTPPWGEVARLFVGR